MNENTLIAVITSITAVLTALITAGTQIALQVIKSPPPKLPPVRQIIRKINLWIIVVSTVLAVLIMGAILLWKLPKTTEYSSKVSTQCPTFSPTGVNVEKGDDVEIIVQGADSFWDCGRGHIGPTGYFGEKYPTHFLPSANACELIGYIGESDVYFRVGYHTQFTAADTGVLYLGINDAKDQCEGNPIGNLPVKIFVTKK